MEKNPLVSIILGSYNGQAYLADQLTSIANQTYNNIEVICSDNNSSDNSYLILKKWCSESIGRQLVNNPIVGINKNYFSAINYTSGKYVIFSDQDDIWDKDKISKLVKFYESNQGFSMVYCLSEKFQDNIFTVTKKKWINRLEGQEIKKSLLISHTLGHNIIIKRETLLKIPIPQNEMVAFDWWITISAMCIGPIKCFPEYLTFWRQHQTNTTKKINQDLFYISRIKYLSAFLDNPLISSENKVWIKKAKILFKKLESNRFSIQLFLFIFLNSKYIFFYKTKKNKVLKWISFFKWSIRLSSNKTKP